MSRGARAKGLFLLAVLALTACETPEAASTWTVALDTPDGRPRVVNTPPAAGAVPTRVAEEELRLGTLEGGGPTSFGVIRSVAVLPDGRFAVADAQAEEVRVFDRSGAHLHTFGGSGQGPGELQGMQGVHVDHRGMLRVAEQANGRLSVFHPDSGFVTSYRLRLFTYGFRGPGGAAVDSTGRTLVASSGQYGEGRFWNMLRTYDAEMNQLDSVPYHEYTGQVDEDQPGAWRIELGENAWTWAAVPFYSMPKEALAPSGEFWTSTEGTPELEVSRWTPGGDTSLVLVSRRPPQPVTPAERDSAMNAIRKRFAERNVNLRGLDASRVPATKPPLYALSLDDRGRLWVRLTDPAADSAVYDVFDRDGRLAETVLLPFPVDPWVPPVVHGDTAWLVVTDDLDVQYVVRARLRPAGEGSSS